MSVTMRKKLDVVYFPYVRVNMCGGKQRNWSKPRVSRTWLSLVKVSEMMGNDISISLINHRTQDNKEKNYVGYYTVMLKLSARYFGFGFQLCFLDRFIHFRIKTIHFMWKLLRLIFFFVVLTIFLLTIERKCWQRCVRFSVCCRPP